MQDWNEPIYLTEDELFGVTGSKRRSRQAQWFRENGFRFLERVDQSILVSRNHFEFHMGGKLDRMFMNLSEPDFGSLD